MGTCFGKLSESSHCDSNGLILNGYVLSPELLSLILLNVPGRDLVNNCQLVCKTWKQLISSYSFWKRTVVNAGVHFPNCLASYDLRPNAYRSIVTKNPFGRNLIRNPYGQEELKGWHINANQTRGRHGFKIQNFEDDSDSLGNIDELRGVATSCFTTTFYPCRKQQVIDLQREGCSQEIMQTLKPAIYICDWYAAPLNCGCRYFIQVYLYSNDRVLIDKVLYWYNMIPGTGKKWTKMEHTFTYKTELVRYVRFSHEAAALRGPYGIKMTGSTVLIKFD